MFSWGDADSQRRRKSQLVSANGPVLTRLSLQSSSTKQSKSSGLAGVAPHGPTGSIPGKEVPQISSVAADPHKKKERPLSAPYKKPGQLIKDADFFKSEQPKQIIQDDDSMVERFNSERFNSNGGLPSHSVEGVAPLPPARPQTAGSQSSSKTKTPCSTEETQNDDTPSEPRTPSESKRSSDDFQILPDIEAPNVGAQRRRSIDTWLAEKVDDRASSPSTAAATENGKRPSSATENGRRSSLKQLTEPTSPVAYFENGRWHRPSVVTGKSSGQSNGAPRGSLVSDEMTSVSTEQHDSQKNVSASREPDNAVVGETEIIDEFCKSLCISPTIEQTISAETSIESKHVHRPNEQVKHAVVSDAQSSVVGNHDSQKYSSEQSSAGSCVGRPEASAPGLSLPATWRERSLLTGTSPNDSHRAPAELQSGLVPVQTVHSRMNNNVGNETKSTSVNPVNSGKHSGERTASDDEPKAMISPPSSPPPSSPTVWRDRRAKTGKAAATSIENVDSRMNSIVSNETKSWSVNPGNSGDLSDETHASNHEPKAKVSPPTSPKLLDHFPPPTSRSLSARLRERRAKASNDATTSIEPHVPKQTELVAEGAPSSSLNQPHQSDNLPDALLQNPGKAPDSGVVQVEATPGPGVPKSKHLLNSKTVFQQKYATMSKAIDAEAEQKKPPRRRSCPALASDADCKESTRHTETRLQSFAEKCPHESQLQPGSVPVYEESTCHTKTSVQPIAEYGADESQSPPVSVTGCEESISQTKTSLQPSQSPLGSVLVREGSTSHTKTSVKCTTENGAHKSQSPFSSVDPFVFDTENDAHESQSLSGSGLVNEESTSHNVAQTNMQTTAESGQLSPKDFTSKSREIVQDYSDKWGLGFAKHPSRKKQSEHNSVQEVLKKWNAEPPNAGISKNKVNVIKQRIEKVRHRFKPEKQLLGLYKSAASIDLPNIHTSECLVLFSYHERSVLKNYFEIYDVDRSGTLSITELMLVIDDMDRTPMPKSADERTLNHLFKVTDKDNSGELDFTEFLNLMEWHYHCVYYRVFTTHDYDKSGTISTYELGPLMRELAMARFYVEYSDVQSLVMQGDKDDDGVLDFNEFCDLMEHYRLLEFKHLELNCGFSSSKLEMLRIMFSHADHDNSGALDLKEILTLLDQTSLGKSSPLRDPETLDDFVEVFSLMDKDRSATLDWAEFLRLIWVWDKMAFRPPRRRKVGKGPNEQADEHERKPRRRSMTRAETVMSVAENQVLVTGKGLTIAEVEALRENFVFSDADGSGRIDAHELSTLLKNCGCDPTTQTQKLCLSSCLAAANSDGTELESQLDFHQVVELVLQYYDACAHAVAEHFQSKLESDDGLPIDQLVVVFYQVGQYLSRAQVDQLLSKVGFDPQTEGSFITEDVFRKMLNKHREKRLSEWRTTYGFRQDHILEFQAVFEKNCITGTRVIALPHVKDVAKELGFYEYCPESAEEDALVFERFVDFVQGEYNQDEISFGRFLLLLKQLDTHKQMRILRDQQDLAATLGIDEDTLSQLQKLFKGYDDKGTGLVSKKSIRSLFSTWNVAKTQESRKLLRKLLDEISHEGLDFTQFLGILHKLESS